MSGWSYRDIDEADFYHLSSLFAQKKQKVIPLENLIQQMQGGGK
jgi:hypothetical protein